MKYVVFGQPWGGLGDNLQFTTLPKLYAEKGIDFYLSTHNAYRNLEIYDMVWKNNPFVKGISDEYPNIGSCVADTIGDKKAENIISAAEVRHGFVGEGRYPDIYYEPTLLNEFKDKTIVDLGAHSLFKYGLSNYYNIERLFDKIKNSIDFEDKNTLSVLFRNIKFDSIMTPSQSVQIDSLKHYADIIHSCKNYYCLYSGGNSLAAALKYKYNSSVSIHSFLHGTLEEHKKKSYFVFDNVNYIEIF